MEPLIALVVVTLALTVVGRLRGTATRRLPVALRGGLAVMFLMTGVAHFIGMRSELIAMVPSGLPAAGTLVTLTGIAEICGALALLHKRTALLAAIALSLMLVAMFPANVHLALTGADLPWHDELLPRTIMQIIFFAATTTVVVDRWRARRGASARSLVAAAG